ncbi:MAG: Tfx family DNA-binding protein [Methanomicrobiales archaeon]|nr:Tfx family DNA-binding protein [Methanomicrobiales archaeon]
MKEGFLTDRQKEVLRYRKQGLTHQKIADIINTTNANVCTIEKSARENITRAKETIRFLYTLDASHLCSIQAGKDQFEVPRFIYAEADKRGIKVRYDTVSLINKIRAAAPERFKAGVVIENIDVYIVEDGELNFG